MNIFGILFGWRKASQCKKLARRVRCRLKFLKIRRYSMVKQSRQDIAQLISNGLHETAFCRAEELFRDQNLLAAYDLLDHFCESIIIHLPHIRRQRNCPNDIKEAVSTLIFAAAWCGDLPELQKIQRLFRERYGQKFTNAAIELHPGHQVNTQLRERLCLKSIPDNVKQSLVDELVKDYGIQDKQVLAASSCDEEKPENLSGYADQVENSVVKYVYEPAMIEITLSGQSNSESCGSNHISGVSLEEKMEMERTITPSNEFLYLEEVEEIHFDVLEEHYAGEITMFLFNSTALQERNRHGFPQGSCSRSMTVTPVRLKEVITSSNSSSPWHVHPKLPDYDELVAKFKALKKEHQQMAAAALNKT
ncbi:hypothetical protein SLA2020_468560 [Shorea laevis]